MIFTAPQRKVIAAARRELKARYGVNKILTNPASNPKIAKNSKISGILTAPLHFAPAKISGYEVCPMASSGCRSACLHSAGNPVYMPAKTLARTNKTIAFFEARTIFMIVLVAEIAALEKKADKLKMFAGVRLNATSDLPFEKTSFNLFGKVQKNIMELFPNVTFYDYTKRYNRVNLPANYHLTFSLAENNDGHAKKWLDNGGNVAVVFAGPLPLHYCLSGTVYKVIDGDLTDYRPDDGYRVIVGLKAKGKARKDRSGFVRAANCEDLDRFARKVDSVDLGLAT